MRSFSPRQLIGSPIALLVLAGCASMQLAEERGTTGPAARYGQVLDSIAAARSLGEGEMAAAPRIRLVVPSGGQTIMPYVDASFHLTDDAYVLVVAVDLDRRVRVLHPESPNESGFAARSSSHRLTRFFGGFALPRSSAQRYYDASNRISPVGGGGVLLAVASERPLQLERLMGQDGDWDERELSRLIFEQSLPSAAQAIGRALVLTGQEFNTDYSTFSGRRMLGSYSMLASNSFGECGSGYASPIDARSPFGYGAAFDAGMTAFVGFFQRDGQRFARYAYGTGTCSRPLYYDVPVPTGPAAPRDTTVRDSTAPPRRIPRFPGAPRFPAVVPDSGTRTLGRQLQPPVSGGLRFRPPEQVSVDVMRPGRDRISPRDAESAARRRPSEDSEAMRSNAAERRAAEESRRVERAQQAERRAEQAERRAEPAERRAEPAERRAEPRAESQPREPVQREPMSREPSRTTPTPR